ncbi:MAG: hypothetical protein J6C46_10490 [Clostridia bacterium]|nr:hypothetical protein [Clostridia bacterium]
MKSFLKLIVSIVVIIVIGVTLYFLLQGMTMYNEKDTSGDTFNNELSGNVIVENSNLSESEKENNEEYLEDSQNKNSGENLNNEKNLEDSITDGNSGENIIENEVNTIPSNNLTEEQINQAINDANMIENQNNNEIVINTIEDNIGIDMIGEEYKELLNMLNSNTLTVNVQTAGTMIYILPMSDFVNNQQYHYDENGNLVLYISELMGIGGELRYYFLNNQLIKTEETVDGELFMKYEDTNQILQKSKLVYDKYFRQ